MPEATVHEDDFSRPDERKVRRAWDVAAMKPVSTSQSVNQSADGHLRAGVLAPHQ
jgi:hypothetical protein